jgi:outer membrane protein OmpA-like peptidoglycan-associated protein
MTCFVGWRGWQWAALAMVTLGLVAATPASAAEPPNLVSAKAGATVVARSSSYGGSWDVENLVANQERSDGAVPTWCTANGAPFPHWAVIQLPKRSWLTTLVFNNFLPDERGWPGISAKDVELQVSDQSASAGFQTVARFQLERNENNQMVRLEPAQGRWLKIVITSNWGNPDYTELGQLGAFDDGSRRQNVAGVLETKGTLDVYGIYFDFASATLREESSPVLGSIAAYLGSNPSVRLAVEGHTDKVGDAKANLVLSENRARAVVAALGKLGIESQRLDAAGFGAQKPIASNDTITGRAQNRRVTLRVLQ